MPIAPQRATSKPRTADGQLAGTWSAAGSVLSSGCEAPYSTAASTPDSCFLCKTDLLYASPRQTLSQGVLNACKLLRTLMACAMGQWALLPAPGQYYICPRFLQRIIAGSRGYKSASMMLLRSR